MLIIGILVAGAGWYFLLEGVGVAGVGGSGNIMNLHLAQIANNVIYLGYFLVLVGSVREGFSRIERYLAGMPRMKAAFDEAYRAPKFRKYEPTKAPK
jgi:hypothetical protein